VLERAAIVGGQVTLESADGRGTRIGIELPIRTSDAQTKDGDVRPVINVREKVPL